MRTILCIALSALLAIGSGCSKSTKRDGFGRSGTVTGKRYIPALGGDGEQWIVNYTPDTPSSQELGGVAHVDRDEYKLYEVGDHYPK